MSVSKGAKIIKSNRSNENYPHNVVFFCDQFKKSGKEPKAGAELVFGKTTCKTKV